MTNLQLTIMIAAYCGSKEMDHYTDTETYRDQVTQLLDEGVITLDNSPKGSNYKFMCTNKGKFWLDYVLALPFPVEVKEWRIPI